MVTGVKFLVLRTAHLCIHRHNRPRAAVGAAATKCIVLRSIDTNRGKEGYQTTQEWSVF